MSITKWLEKYDRLARERTMLYDHLEEIGEWHEEITANAYEMQDLADEAASILRSIQRGDHL